MLQPCYPRAATTGSCAGRHVPNCNTSRRQEEQGPGVSLYQQGAAGWVYGYSRFKHWEGEGAVVTMLVCVRSPDPHPGSLRARRSTTSRYGLQFHNFTLLPQRTSNDIGRMWLKLFESAIPVEATLISSQYQRRGGEAEFGIDYRRGQSSLLSRRVCGIKDSQNRASSLTAFIVLSQFLAPSSAGLWRAGRELRAFTNRLPGTSCNNQQWYPLA